MAEEDRTRDDPDAELVQACKQGDRQAFNELVRRHQSRVYILAFRLLGDRGEAEDLTQEVFLKAYRFIAQFEGNSKFSVWLYRIVYTSYLNQSKRMAWWKKLVWWGGTEDDDSEDPLANLSSEEPDPSQHLERKDLHHRLQHAIANLSPNLKSVVVLYEIMGLSYDEIADVLNIPLNTVKVRLHRARKALQDALRPFLPQLV